MTPARHIPEPVTRANGQPAYMQAKPRLRQSEIDAERAWKASDVRTLRGGV